MYKYRHLSVVVISVLLLVGLGILIGCGGSSGGHGTGPAVDNAVREYRAADSETDFEAAVLQIEAAIGATDPSSSLNDFAITGTYLDFFATQCVFDKDNGIPATVDEILERWRMEPKTGFETSTETFLTELKVAISGAKGNPSGSGASLLLAIEKLDRAINPTLAELRAESRSDAMLSHMLSMWSIEHFGLPVLPENVTRASAKCDACIARHKAKCKEKYDRKISNLTADYEATLASINRAVANGTITAASAARHRQNATNFFNDNSVAASLKLEACRAGAPAACKKQCHEQ